MKIHPCSADVIISIVMSLYLLDGNLLPDISGTLTENKERYGILTSRRNRNFIRTTKPTPLVALPIQNSSVVNSVILEPFGGSGSTLIACEQTDRICYAIEIDEKFVDVIVRRYVDFKENSDDVFLLRNGEKIPYSEVLTNE